MMIDLTRCPSAISWDEYVLGRPSHEREQLESHVRICPCCQVLVADRQAYYRRLFQIAAGETTGRGAGEVIRLNPSALLGHEDIGTIRQAAAGPEQPVVPKAWTLLSEDSRWMIKVLRDSSDGHLKLFLLSAASESVSGILVRLSGLPASHLTDNDGCIDLGTIDWPHDKEPHAEVIMPAATFILNAADQLLTPGTSTLLQSAAGDTIRIAAEPSDGGYRLLLEVVALSRGLEGRPLRLLVTSSPNSEPIPLEPALVLDNFRIPGRLEILLFP